MVFSLPLNITDRFFQQGSIDAESTIPLQGLGVKPKLLTEEGLGVKPKLLTEGFLFCWEFGVNGNLGSNLNH